MDKQPKAPIIEGGPSFDDTGSTATGTQQLAPIPAGARVYISTQGDWWDLIAIKVYGVRRGNEHLMYRLLEENYYLREIMQFPAGIPVIVPEVDVVTEIPLVPWKSATRLPTT